MLLHNLIKKRSQIAIKMRDNQLFFTKNFEHLNLLKSFKNSRSLVYVILKLKKKMTF